jgi:peroxiredoxin
MGVLQLAVMEPSATLKVGDVAPEFSLAAANSADVVSLNDTLRNGSAIVEFLRGTW